MKNLRTTLLCACVLLSAHFVQAQNSNDVSTQDKPKLFNAIADNVAVDVDKLISLLKSDVGTDVSIAFGTSFQFQGQVVSTASNYEDRINSIVIRSTNFPGARLTFSKIHDNGKTSYAGRILSMQHGDIFELQQRNGQYYFIKRNLHDIVNE